MPDDSDLSPRQRFSRDLRRIRQDREVSLATLHEATQVPESHLEAFEEGNLYEESRMNAVYLKAFVRAYAEAVGLPPDPVVEQLEAALSGEYQNQLAVEYLGASSTPEASSSIPEKDPAESPATDPSASEDPTSEVTSTEDPKEDAVEDTESIPSQQVEESSGAHGAPSKTSVGRKPSDPSSPSPARSASGPVRSGRGGKAVSWRLLTLTVTALGVLVVAAWGLVSYTGAFRSTDKPTSSTERPTGTLQQTAESPSFADSVPAAGDTSEAPDTTGSSGVEGETASVELLADTMYVTVQATAPVRELRVQQDDDLRRPYWIQEGEALVFPFARRITLQNQLDSLRLFLDQYPFPTTRTDPEGRVVITRDVVEQFADTLRGSPATISSTPDTVNIQTPSPAPDTTNGPT